MLHAAEQLASLKGVPVATRHVARVLFCDHQIGPRLAWSTRKTDIRGLQAELRQYADSKTGSGSGEDALFIRAVKNVRPDRAPKCLEDLMFALYDPSFELRSIFESNGLEFEEMQANLPRALRAVRMYEKQHAKNVASLSRVQSSSGSGGASSSSVMDGRPAGAPQNAGIAASKMIKQLGQASSVPINERVPSYDSDSAKERSAALSSFAVDLVELARLGRLDPVIGRDAEITRVLQVLSRRTKNNVCLVGAPGVGKTAVAEAVAQRIAAGHVPHQLRNCKELWSLDIGALIAGTGLRGDFEERLKVVLSVLRASGGEAMLFIDELHLVLGAGRSENNNVDAANLMKPLLARGEIRCIGATTNNEYRSLILEKDAAFERRFQPIELEEPKPEVAEEMLRGLSNLYAQHHEITVAPSTLKAAVHLSIRHIKGRSLPDKAIDVLDEACCLAACEGATSVEERHVQTVISRWQPPPWQRDAGPLHRSFAWVQQQWSRL